MTDVDELCGDGIANHTCPEGRDFHVCLSIEVLFQFIGRDS
jgi:hypothetical protein